MRISNFSRCAYLHRTHNTPLVGQVSTIYQLMAARVTLFDHEGSCAMPRRIWLLSVLLPLLFHTQVTAFPFTRLVIFGDSLSDVGNIEQATFGFVPGGDYFDGRFSNGPLWADVLNSNLGLAPLNHSRNGGYNYAHGGAETGGGTQTLGIIRNMGRQVSNYLGSRTPSSSELFVLLGGGNDFDNGQTNASIPVANMSGHITNLANAGAEHFLVLNLPPLERTPKHHKTNTHFTIKQATLDYNAQLHDELISLESSLNVNIIEFDLFRMFGILQKDPAVFGATNTWDAAYDEDNGNVVSNPDEYLFWDGLHPTRVAHEIIGNEAYAMVVPVTTLPEPGTAALLLLTGSAMALRRQSAA